MLIKFRDLYTPKSKQIKKQDMTSDMLIFQESVRWNIAQPGKESAFIGRDMLERRMIMHWYCREA